MEIVSAEDAARFQVQYPEFVVFVVSAVNAAQPVPVVIVGVVLTLTTTHINKISFV
jgi:hypothetical protein